MWLTAARSGTQIGRNKKILLSLRLALAGNGRMLIPNFFRITSAWNVVVGAKVSGMIVFVTLIIIIFLTDDVLVDILWPYFGNIQSEMTDMWKNNLSCPIGDGLFRQLRLICEYLFYIVLLVADFGKTGFFKRYICFKRRFFLKSFAGACMGRGRGGGNYTGPQVEGILAKDRFRIKFTRARSRVVWARGTRGPTNNF